MSAPAAASGRMEANEPANITGANSSRVKMTICGPRMAVMMPPASTKEMARALNSGGALSAAAKRNCWTKAPPMPITSRPKANSQKLAVEKRQSGDQAAKRGDDRAGHEAAALAEPRG